MSTEKHIWKESDKVFPELEVRIRCEDEEEGLHLVITTTEEGITLELYSVDYDGNDLLLGTKKRSWNELMQSIVPSAPEIIP